MNIHHLVLTTSLAFVSLTAGAWADPSHGPSSGHNTAIGAPGKATDATRSIDVILGDNFFNPDKIAVKKGETIQFVVTNKGEFVHEFNIGTAAMHAAHQKEMMMMEHGALEADRINRDRMMMDMGDGKTMQHDDPNSILLEPGQSGEVIWTFDTDSELEIGCNVPGHYEAGMVVPIHMSR
jgi:uncharacterized cupredoxin-like copper-binding protein